MNRLWKICLCALLVLSAGCTKADSKAESANTSEETAEPTAEPTPKPEPVVSEATLFMVGDALLHMTINSDADQYDGSYDYSSMLSRLSAIAGQYDLAYYNQETILAGEEFGYSGYPTFNSPQDWGDQMVEAGFNLVSTANNHCLDRWTDGIEASLDYWDSKEGVIHAGTNRTPEEADTIRYGEVNGIKFAFLSWCENMNGFWLDDEYSYYVNCFAGREDEMLDQVREAKRNSDVVIFAMHWGVEYSLYPEDWQRELAAELADAGADIIIGNHPHVIQPIEWIGDTICFYALGNIIAAQYDESRIGILASLKITKTEDEVMKKVEISDVKADLHYTYYDEGTYVNFDIIPFSQMDEAHLWNYQEVYDEFSQIITEMDDSITVGGF